MRIPRRLRSERGSAVVEFPLIAALIVLIGLATIQAAIIVHVRNTLVSCAAEGARYGAREGSSPEQGAARARDLISSALSERYARGVTARVDTTSDGVEVVVVDVVAPVPVVGPLGPGEGFDVTGRAFLETQ